MARWVKRDAVAPVQFSGHACMCGLSKNQPACDGSHLQCKGEDAGKLYAYENGKRREVKAP